MTTAGDQAVSYARAQIGKPYSTFPDGVNTFDCSLLVQKAWESAGVSLPRTTFQQIFSGTEVSKADLLPGDLVFPYIGHVQIYVGNGEIIEAPQPGEVVHQVKMWGFWRARRVGDPGAAIQPAGLTKLPGNPFNPASWPVLKELEGIATTLTKASFWHRAGLVGLGLFVIVLALAFIKRHEIGQAAKVAVKTGTKAAEAGAVAA